jgi:hypothetical protein
LNDRDRNDSADVDRLLRTLGAAPIRYLSFGIDRLRRQACPPDPKPDIAAPPFAEEPLPALALGPAPRTPSADGALPDLLDMPDLPDMRVLLDMPDLPGVPDAPVAGGGHEQEADPVPPAPRPGRLRLQHPELRSGTADRDARLPGLHDLFRS